ncbi:hypothetical protein A1O7_01022 [Cladophialophora yegresii CBS 114405]|uniref:MOSC domain-containing protein n=1 Tax=Cladophialophora yegresii CBS 114405 TaxID=1182544 RepID=W9X2G3_9EURO|nr:uncharacterized protein A1O7_01022 [Cladophialophora yegresii CBS 114405]EXJ64684.1 hypothetical protein A1O7_01022 [Cladophialophora yegresii CBS 114405]
MTRTGLKHDRSFILIKDIEAHPSEHLTIKTLSKLCLFQPSIDSRPTSGPSPILRVTHTLSGSEIEFPLTPVPQALRDAREFTMEIFGTRATGLDLGDDIAAWFSKHLEQKARLLYIGGGGDDGAGTREIVAPQLIPRKPRQQTGILSWLRATEGDQDELHTHKIQFADAAPLLITTVSSEEDAKSRIPIDADAGEGDEASDDDVITRFRSNIHIDNAGQHISDDEKEMHSQSAPYAEEQWKTLHIMDIACEENPTVPIRLDLVFSTVRCQSLNVDFRTGGLVTPERQLFKLLAKDRRVNPSFPYRPCFGRYAFAEPFSRKIRVGDRVEVVEWIEK